MTRRTVPDVRSRVTDTKLAGAEVVERFFMLLNEKLANDPNLTVEKFAHEVAGINRGTLEKWRCGTSPRLDEIARAFAHLGYALVPLPTSAPRLSKQTLTDYWLPRTLEFERIRRKDRQRSATKERPKCP